MDTLSDYDRDFLAEIRVAYDQPDESVGWIAARARIQSRSGPAEEEEDDPPGIGDWQWIGVVVLGPVIGIVISLLVR